MRNLKLIALAGVILASGVVASATPVNWIQKPGYERVRFNILDWSMAKTYVPPVLVPVEGVAAVDALPQTPAPPGAMPIVKPQVGLGGIGGALLGNVEDFWGVIQIQEIIADPGGTVFWSGAVDPQTEIVGLLYGGVDTYVAIDPATGVQTVSAAGLFLDLYAQPKGTFDETLGSAGRVAFDKYEGVGYDAAGVLIPGADLLLALESTDDKAPADATLASDIDGDGDPDGDFTATFTPNPPPLGAGTGESSLFWDIVGGTWGPVPPPHSEEEVACHYEVEQFYFPNRDPRFGSSQFGDMHSGQDFDPAAHGPSDWIVTSDDPTRGFHYIPEPVTLVGAFLGIATLGGYLRRRRG